MLVSHMVAQTMFERSSRLALSVVGVFLGDVRYEYLSDVRSNMYAMSNNVRNTCRVCPQSILELFRVS